MRKKRYIDIIICCFLAAIMMLCYTYMEREEQRQMYMIICGALLLFFFILFWLDSPSHGHRKGKTGKMIQQLLLLDEEGNEISAWHIGGKTSVLIGRDAKKENVDINLQNTEYGGMVERQHAVLNYAGGQWYIEDLGSKNGVKIQKGRDGELYRKIGRAHV